MPEPWTIRKFRARVLRPALAALLVIGGGVAWLVAGSENFAAVRPGDFYRSGQLAAPSLASKLREHHVRTVLNLRGSHPESAWYRAERDATLAAGATQVNIPLSSCEWMSRAQARALLEVLETAERPILVHCFHGSERTGMVSAFGELLRSGSTLADAERQFSMRYLYFHWGDGVVTYRHLEAYEGWLRSEKLDHSPDHLRRWLATAYVPGHPSREDWEKEPTPPVITSRQGAEFRR